MRAQRFAGRTEPSHGGALRQWVGHGPGAPPRPAVAVYPVDGTPYSISRGMLQTVHGGAGFVVTSGCNGFVMEPGLGAGGLPVARPAVPPFTDLATAPHRGAIVAESIMCVWRGFPDGTFHPNAPLTRAQLAALLTDSGTCGARPRAPVGWPVARSRPGRCGMSAPWSRMR